MYKKIRSMTLQLIAYLLLTVVPVEADTVFRGINAYPELLRQCQEDAYPMDTVEDCVRFSAVKPPPRDLWTQLCLGDDEMKAAYKAQKQKYCDCLHDMIYYKQPNNTLKNLAKVCMKKYPPLK